MILGDQSVADTDRDMSRAVGALHWPTFANTYMHEHTHMIGKRRGRHE